MKPQFFGAALCLALAGPALADGSGQVGPYKYEWRLREDRSVRLVVVDKSVPEGQTLGATPIKPRRYVVTTSSIDRNPIKARVVGTFGPKVNAAIRKTVSFNRPSPPGPGPGPDKPGNGPDKPSKNCKTR